jgi:hypothetical protein
MGNYCPKLLTIMKSGRQAASGEDHQMAELVHPVG